LLYFVQVFNRLRHWQEDIRWQRSCAASVEMSPLAPLVYFRYCTIYKLRAMYRGIVSASRTLFGYHEILIGTYCQGPFAVEFSLHAAAGADAPVAQAKCGSSICQRNVQLWQVHSIAPSEHIAPLVKRYF
jgi:hypothetical protein